MSRSVSPGFLSTPRPVTETAKKFKTCMCWSASEPLIDTTVLGPLTLEKGLFW